MEQMNTIKGKDVAHDLEYLEKKAIAHEHDTE